MSRPLPIHPTSGLTALWVSPSGRAFYPIAGGDGRQTGNPVLARLLAQRGEQETFIDQLLARVEEEERDLVDAERSNLEAARQRIADLDQQIEPLESFEAIRAAHRAAAPEPPADDRRDGEQRGTRLSVHDRPTQYRSPGSFLLDLVQARGHRDGGIPVNRDAERRIAQAFETRANQTTTQTPGLLPVEIVGAVLNDIDSARPFVASIGAKDLGGIPGKTFNRPRITQHSQVGLQTAEKVEGVSRQLLIDSVPFTKQSFLGWLNVSKQEIDWTSPAAWDIITTDLETEYAAGTDDWSGDLFAAGVTQTVELAAGTTIQGWINALYDAALMAATANSTVNARALRLPNHIWVSADRWASIGKVIDAVRATTNTGQTVPGSSSPTAFGGDILDVPRTVVPSFPPNTVVVGNTGMFEFYEDRVGLLSAVEPRVFGWEVAYGGYAAAGFLDATAFAKIVDLVAG